MKKLLFVFAIVFVALFLFSFRTITAEEASGGSKQTTKTLVMQASWKPGVAQVPSNPNWTLVQFGDLGLFDTGPVEIVSPASATCLLCHEHTYENLAKRTVNYKDRWGDPVNPHVYVDETKGNPHNALVVPDCLRCHQQHTLPTPTSAMPTVRLNYCYSCHHEESFEACSDCH